MQKMVGEKPTSGKTSEYMGTINQPSDIKESDDSLQLQKAIWVLLI